MADVTVYTRAFCPYCTRAISLLQRKGANVREIDATGLLALPGGIRGGFIAFAANQFAGPLGFRGAGLKFVANAGQLSLQALGLRAGESASLVTEQL